MIVGAAFYALGLALMAHATTPGMLDISAGVLIGLGLSGCSFNLVIGAFGKLLPESWRSLAFGAGTAAGSFGQFLYSPIGVALMDRYGWQTAITIFAGVTMLILPLAMALATPKAPAGQDDDREAHAIGAAGFRGSIRPSQLRLCSFLASSPAASSSLS